MYRATEKLSTEAYRHKLRTGRPFYSLAARIGRSESWLSRVMHGVKPVEEGDPRIQLLCEEIGIAFEEAFEADSA